ncbi:MAG: hypothetical protein M3N51_10830, partial [Actinomycetota bacterium]|nr:hypothetical protein [Actinomycetota bacterium]
MLSDAGRIRTERGTANRSPSRRARLLGLLAVAAVTGLVLGRFVTFHAPAPPVPAPAAASSPEQAIAVLEQRVAEDPDDFRSLQELGMAYLRRAAQVGDPSFYGLAEQAFGRAEALAPSD